MRVRACFFRSVFLGPSLLVLGATCNLSAMFIRAGEAREMCGENLGV